MRRSLLGLLAGVHVGLLTPASSAITVINFDDISVPQGGAVNWSGSRYAGLGVQFLAPAGGSLVAADGSFDTAPIFVCGTLHFPRADGSITASFANAVGFVSFNVIDHADAPDSFWSAQALDAQGNVLASVNDNRGTLNNPFPVTFSRATPDIQRVVFTPSADYEGIDTLAFDVPSPESAAPALVLLFGGCRRARPNRAPKSERD